MESMTYVKYDTEFSAQHRVSARYILGVIMMELLQILGKLKLMKPMCVHFLLMLNKLPHAWCLKQHKVISCYSSGGWKSKTSSARLTPRCPRSCSSRLRGSCCLASRLSWGWRPPAVLGPSLSLASLQPLVRLVIIHPILLKIFTVIILVCSDSP